MDGEKWRHQRKMASYEFSTKVLRDYSSVVFKTNASLLCQLVSEAATLNQMIDIQVSTMGRWIDIYSVSLCMCVFMQVMFGF